jgi:hypothetical protein
MIDELHESATNVIIRIPEITLYLNSLQHDMDVLNDWGIPAHISLKIKSLHYFNRSSLITQILLEFWELSLDPPKIFLLLFK